MLTANIKMCARAVSGIKKSSCQKQRAGSEKKLDSHPPIVPNIFRAVSAGGRRAYKRTGGDKRAESESATDSRKRELGAHCHKKKLQCVARGAEYIFIVTGSKADLQKAAARKLKEILALVLCRTHTTLSLLLSVLEVVVWRRKCTQAQEK